MEFEFTLLKCQDCDAKIHCADCGREIEDRLLLRGVRADADMQAKRLKTDSDMDRFDLLDLLEEIGVFAD